MDAPNAVQLGPFDENTAPRLRTMTGNSLASSIWAPQPKQVPKPEAIWPSEERFRTHSMGAAHQRLPSEDFFTSAKTLKNARGVPRNVGAIGDGRKSQSPSDEDIHVSQLLRTLNLNSPDSYASYSATSQNRVTAQRPTLDLSLTLNSPTLPSHSPDFSPISTNSSNLSTPTDISPSRAFFDAKFGISPGYDGSFAPSPRSALGFGSNAHIVNSSPSMGANVLPITSTRQAGFGFGMSTAGCFSDAPLRTKLPPTPISAYASPFPSNLSQDAGEPPYIGARGGFESSFNSSLFDSPSQQHFSSLNNSLKSQLNSSEPFLLDSSIPSISWRQQARNQLDTKATNARLGLGILTGVGVTGDERDLFQHRPSFSFSQPQSPVTSARVSPPAQAPGSSSPQHNNDPINFLSLLHPSSSPPYHTFVNRIIKSSDQQASIFLQQKLKVADTEERSRIIDAICSRGFELMAHRFGNWAAQRCLEAAETPEERRKIVACMKGRIVELATNCYGCHVLQKALDCEEDIRLLIVSELLRGDPAQTLINKHASHVWSKIMELTWTPPAPPIFAHVNKSLKGKWASLACHETGSLVVQHAFENLEDSAKEGIVDELLNQGQSVFSDVAKNQWGSYCIQHILEHGSEKHRQMALDHLINGLLEYSIHEQGSKSVNKALKEGGEIVLDRIIKRMSEPAKGARRAMIVDLALSATGSQLIAAVLPSAGKEQRSLLYDCIRGHIVTLRGCKTGSKVIWLFDRMRAYYGY